jgi:hypothetical protein
MNKGLGWLVVIALNLISLPAFAQAYETGGPSMMGNPWQDTASAPAGTGAYRSGAGTRGANRYSGQLAAAAGLAGQSVNPAAINSGQFKLGFGAAGPQTGRYGSTLPPVATSSVNLSICDAPAPIPSQSCGSTGSQSSGNGDDGQQQEELPYAPGPDWAAVCNSHSGALMGYMAPGETFQEFFSGQSGHILPSQLPEGQWILQNQLGDMAGSTAMGF